MGKYFSLRSLFALRGQLNRPDERLRILSAHSDRFNVITQQRGFDGLMGETLEIHSVPGDRFRIVTHQEDVLRHRERYVELGRAHSVTVLRFLRDAARHAVSVSVYSCLET